MKTEQVNVSVTDDCLDRFSEVVKRIEKAGLKVEQQLEAVGVVTGSIDVDKNADLNQVPGVAAVEPVRAYQLPPPDADVQ
jgi:hypothetical protein